MKLESAPLNDEEIDQLDRFLLDHIDDDAEVMHGQIDRLTKYDHSLSNARDLLLPRLMNGEVAV